MLDGPGNQLWAYHDQPRVYDAWDLEGDYRRAGQQLKAEKIEIVEAGGQRGALRVTYRVGAQHHRPVDAAVVELAAHRLRHPARLA